MELPLFGRDALLAAAMRAMRKGSRSVVLEGEMGVGKSRLARTLAESLRLDGWHVEMCLGSPTVSSIPFGAVSHLVPQLTSNELLLALEATSSAVVARANGTPLLLVVDDAHDLDEASMALVHRVAAFDRVVTLITRRSGEPGNDEAITTLWKDEVALRFEVLPLDRQAHDELVSEMLGRSRAAGITDRLWHLTGGNPLFLRELLRLDLDDVQEWLHGHADETIVVTASSYIPQLILSRTESLSEAARDALEVIAFAEPIPVHLLARLADASAVRDLERRGMIAAEVAGEDARFIRTAHPVYGATLRARLPTLRRRALASTLGAALIDDGLQAHGDALKAAKWIEEAHEQLSGELALRAAEEALARGDALLAERLANMALASDPSSPDTLIVLGTAFSMRGMSDEALQALDRACLIARDDSTRTRAAIACARHHGWTSREFARGRTTLEEALSAVMDPGRRSELQAELAFFSAASGDAFGTIRIAREILDDGNATERASLTALVHSTRARAMLGAFHGIEVELDRGEKLAAAHKIELPLALDQVSNNRAFWLRFIDLAQAHQVARSAYDRSMREGGASGLWSGTLAWLSADMGDLDAALALLRRGRHEFERFDPFHNVIMLHALFALIHAVRGEQQQGEEWVAGAGPLERMEPRSRVWTQRAQVWLTSRDPVEATRIAMAAGEHAEQETILTWGAALLYHDAVRLGQPQVACGPLARVAAATTAPLVATMAEHARAAAERDVGCLSRVAIEFNRCGSPLLAAEALAQAATAPALVETERNRLAARAYRLAEECPGAATPLLTQIVSPLSEREWEIARSAWSGESSRDIARRLTLSVRTVDNHLGSVYRRLGLSGRDELSLCFE